MCYYTTFMLFDADIARFFMLYCSIVFYVSIYWSTLSRRMQGARMAIQNRTIELHVMNQLVSFAQRLYLFTRQAYNLLCFLLFPWIFHTQLEKQEEQSRSGKHLHSFSEEVKADPPFINGPLLLSRATVQIFPGKKCRLCFSPFHSGTVFTHAETAIQQVGFLGTKEVVLQ